MSPEENQIGSEDGVVSFEELDEAGDVENTGENPPANSVVEETVQAAKGYKYPTTKSKTYKCPPGYAWDPAKKTCVKVQKEIAGPEQAELVEVIEESKTVEGATTSPTEMAAAKDKYPYSCPAGEVWDPKKNKCVPSKEALSERDTIIGDLTKRLQGVENALRLRNIEIIVDEQVQAGHLAPVQREKAISFFSGIPDQKHSGLLEIFSHQKFPLKEEVGATETVASGAAKKGIGEADSAKDLTPDDRKELMKRFKINDLVEEHGVKRAS